MGIAPVEPQESVRPEEVDNSGFQDVVETFITKSFLTNLTKKRGTTQLKLLGLGSFMEDMAALL